MNGLKLFLLALYHSGVFIPSVRLDLLVCFTEISWVKGPQGPVQHYTMLATLKSQSVLRVTGL